MATHEKDLRFLTELELHVLLYLYRLQRLADGAHVGDELRRRTGRGIPQPSVYRVLAGLYSKGWLKMEKSAAVRAPGGPAPRTYYYVDERGKGRVRALARRHAAMWGCPIEPQYF